MQDQDIQIGEGEEGEKAEKNLYMVCFKGKDQLPSSMK